jgi:hypothetical protein
MSRISIKRLALLVLQLSSHPDGQKAIFLPSDLFKSMNLWFRIGEHEIEHRNRAGHREILDNEGSWQHHCLA